jgi:DNA-binding MarR family transcriptional regulator
MLMQRKIDEFFRKKLRYEPDTTWWVYAGVLSEIFGEIIEEDALLEHCYCESRSRKFDEAFIKAVTTGIPEAVFCDSDINPDDFLAEYLPKAELNNPFLILGDVGTGKSTYIHHYFKITLKRLKLDEIIQGIIIDLRDRYIPPVELRRFIDEVIHNCLEKCSNFVEPSFELLNEIFADELRSNYPVYSKLKELDKKEFEISVTKEILNLKQNRHLYNIARIKFLTEKLQQRIFIVIDNVDHYDRNYQIEVFNICRTLMQDYHTPFILTTRHYTFPIAYKHIGLSSFQPRFLNLSFPNTKKMLEKRVDYLFKLNFENKVIAKIKRDFIKMFIRGRVEEVKITDLRERLNIILETLLTEKIIEMLECLSNFDLRTLLKMVKIALSSQFIYPPERETKDEHHKKYVRHYDFLKAVMQGNNFYYDPTKGEATIIQNMFCIGDKTYEGNNLIKIRILQCLYCFGDKVHINKVYEFMESVGYTKERVKKVIKNFLQLDLIESSFNEGYDLDRDNIQFLQLTTTGKYYLKELIKEPSYLDTVKFATYINAKDYDDIFDILKDIKKYSPQERIEARMLSTEAFIEYIRKEEERESQRIIERKLDIKNYKKLYRISDILKSEYKELKEKILPYSPELEL